MIDYNVRSYEYSKRDGNLTNEASGVVKSTKFFPYFYEDGKKMIFKPLSKTKPFSTPYFAYSEVVWSHILNKYFDNTIPVYHLAKCHGYEKEVPKYHDYGTIVESITGDNEYLVNLYEYFMKYPDSQVNIKDYVNYCLCFYDYTFFFETEFIKNNPEIGKEMARQILYSILRADQNYHYENVSFVFEDDKFKRIAKPIDHEFSTAFMYVDYDDSHLSLLGKYILTQLDENSIISKNIELISKLYPDLKEEFLISLYKLYEDTYKNPICLEDYDYIEPFDSEDFMVGQLRYKQNDEEKALKLEKTLVKKKIPVTQINPNLNHDISDVSSLLIRSLEKD